MIQNGRIYDGRGDPPFDGDLAIEADRIIAVGQIDSSRIATALGQAGRGVLPGISDVYDFEAEFKMFRRKTGASGRPRSITVTVEQQDARPDCWKPLLDAVDQAQADQLEIRGQVPPRATDVLVALTATLNDLPAGGRRLIQRATGYKKTIVAGRVAFEEGEPTRALGGRLIRGSQPAPASASSIPRPATPGR